MQMERWQRDLLEQMHKSIERLKLASPSKLKINLSKFPEDKVLLYRLSYFCSLKNTFCYKYMAYDNIKLEGYCRIPAAVSCYCILCFSY